MPKRIIIVLTWMGLLALGAGLRMVDLADRPMHVDEATGARILSTRLESNAYTFDPTHFHGPLLTQSTLPLVWAHGERNWRELSKHTLRLQPVIAGLMLVLLPLAMVRWLGQGGALASAALLATSPILVYYSRMYIHETMLTLWAGLALVMLFSWVHHPGYPRALLTGAAVALMAATKETFSISLLAWAAALALCIPFRFSAFLRENMRKYLRTLPAGILAGLLVLILFYTDGLRHPHGAMDAFRTLFVYETGGGHDKAFSYYAHLLLWPKSSGGTLWWEGLVLIPALLALFYARGADKFTRFLIAFTAFSVLFHFLIYSAISYKTPWLMLVPWMQVILLAGFGFSRMDARRTWLGNGMLLLLAATLAMAIQQSVSATGRLSSDARNPYAYSPTVRDVEALGQWLVQMQEVAGKNGLETVAVVGTAYWPLPWYLRELPSVGYWPQLETEHLSLSALLVMPEEAGRAQTVLRETHVALPRGLRENVPLMVFIRKDIWRQWMNSDSS